MLFIAMIAFIILLCIGIFTILYSIEEKNYLFALLGVICLYVGTNLMVLVCVEDSKPKAIDVYRGNTTLEITYKDSIPIDSVVVFK